LKTGDRSNHDSQLIAKDEPAIRVRKLNVTYAMGEDSVVSACRNIEFDVRGDESVGLLGESGAGKSTVAYAMMGLIEHPNEVKGEILYRGRDVLSMSQEELRGFRWNEVAMVFQAAMNSLDPVVTVGKNMDELIMDKGVARTKEEAKQLSLKLLQTMGLPPEVYKLHPFELSGGMKQRVVIAMALATNPRVLILDEPTTALDTITQYSVLSAIKSLKKEGRIGGTVLISHDISVQAFMVDRVLVLLKGILVEDGPVSDIVDAPKHPYTQLLNGLLKLEAGRGTAGGAQLTAKADQCPFAGSCPYVMPKCTQKIPPLITVQAGHRVACFLYGE
jgi:peptide/nickel transport system ATP-binding protein